jgi:branched-chain amino acid transport system permease protein
MTTIIEFLSIGLALGAVYGLLAIPLSLVWSVTHTVDLAVGGYAVFAGMLAAAIGGPVGVLAALAVGALLGGLMGTFYLLIEARSPGNRLPSLLISVGLLFTLTGLTQILVGIDPQFVSWLPGVVEVAGLRIRWISLVNLAVLAVLAVAAWVILRHTPAGRWIRASADSPRSSALVGIPVRRVQLGGFVVGGVLAALAGVLLLVSRGLSFDMGLSLSLLGLGAVIIFGMRGIVAAVAGSLVLGVVESFAAAYLPSQIAPVVPIAVVLVVLASGVFDVRIGEARP